MYYDIPLIIVSGLEMSLISGDGYNRSLAQERLLPSATRLVTRPAVVHIKETVKSKPWDTS